MKNLLSALLCLATLNGFAQTTESFSQEKSSAWIKVTEDPVTVTKPPATTTRPPATTKKKTTAPSKPSPQKQDAQQEFEKTNSEVNRFKKKKS